MKNEDKLLHQIISCQINFKVPYIFTIIAEYFLYASNVGFDLDANTIIGYISLVILVFATSIISTPETICKS
jgi:hypothetical protein